MEEEKNDIRVEDRRHFDKDGNPREEAGEPVKEQVKEPRREDRKASAPPPKIDFPSLVFLYVQSTLIHLGELEDPVQKKAIENLDAARQMIDIIELLRDKTKGNLTTQEDRYLQEALFDLRMRYVQKAKKP
jgi:hypothetical protein